jgi:hypothetical protein
MITRAPILLLFALLGCADQGTTSVTHIEPSPPHVGSHSSSVPGVVDVLFSEGTTSVEAEQFVKDLNLTFKTPPSGSFLFAVVSVPVGTEDQWVVNLLRYPIVRSAGRIVSTWTD